MSAIIFYLFVWPLSKCPLWLLYRFSDLFYILFISIIPYRKKVIVSNLNRSFPDYSEKEIADLTKQFYRQFSDMLVEGVKNLGMSEDELLRRFKIKNPELMQDLYNQNRSVLLVSAHYMNWEWMISGQSLFFPHQAIGIGMPLSNGFWDRKINALRSRFGMQVIHSKIVKSTFDTYSKAEIPTCTLVLSDQSPGDSLKSYWTTFLNQDTAVAFGAEQLANTYNQAVVFYLPKRIKRGFYEAELQLITDQPNNMKWGEITELHVSMLEKRILEEPQFWLWSHKRWKRDVPENLVHLKNQQREKFNQHYRYN